MQSPNRQICLQATGLTKRFGSRVAVDHLNLEVFRGEVFALLGPDGAGKTTTMRMLSGILPQDEGQARLWEFDTLRQTRQLRERLGYLPQSFGLYDDLTVAENIHFYADLCRVDRAQRRQRLPELLAFANLTPFQDRLADSLHTETAERFAERAPEVGALVRGKVGLEAGDKNGFLLWSHDITGGGVGTLVNYVVTQYTKGTYTVDAMGTVSQITTGYE